MSGGESSLEEALCELADNLVVGSGSFSSPWDAIGALWDSGVLGGEQSRGGGDETPSESGGSGGSKTGGGGGWKAY